MSLVRRTQFVPFLFVSLFLLLLLAACQPVVEQAAAAPVATLASLATVEVAPSPVPQEKADSATAQGEPLVPSLSAASPVEAATAFYTWYLAYIGSPASDNFRNPLVDRAYRQSELLSPAFTAEVDELLASFEGGGYDPFLLAQDIPQSFYVEPGPAPETALAYLQFGDNFHPRLVTCVQTDGAWLITGIAEAEQEAAASSAELAGTAPAADGVTVADDEYGYSFQLPAGWVANELNMQGPGMPDDWPVIRGFQLMPEALAAAQAAQSGPPDPAAEPIIPPLNLSVLQGDQAAFDRVFVPADSSDIVSYNGLELQLQRQGEEYTVVRYVLRHPLDPTLWLVFEDVVSEFPGREAQAQAIADVLPNILSSLSFTQ